MRITRPLVLATLIVATSLSFGQSGIGPITTSVAQSKPRSGRPQSAIAANYSLKFLVSGPYALENPSGIITRFGYLNDFPPQTIEPTKTEPDENTYLVLSSNPGGPTPGYEGIHPDDQGNILLIEDVGGTKVNVDPNDSNSPKAARQPNSFVYRFVPYDKSNLSKGGKLQALQVSIDGKPVVFNANDPVGDTFALGQLQLHTPGTSYPVQWVTVHDTAVDGTTAFDANAAAKAALATPFKRPENAQFAPGANFLTFFFDPTGDTNADSGNTPELAARGAWGSIFRVDLNSDRNTGLISILVLGDADHSSFDNLTFADANTLLAAEDRGDTLHLQLNKLDSVWAFFIDGSPALRFVALGRDTQSEIDAAFLDAGTSGYQNEGDQEPTGLHVSVGSTSASAMPGTIANLENPRAFLTRQHGENVVWEIIKIR